MVPFVWRRWVRHSVGAPARRNVRLQVERCEDRTVPSNITPVRVNNLSFDTPQGFSQSETSTTIIPQGPNPPIVLVSYNSSAAINIDANNAFTSYARSTDGGLTFTDKGTIRPVGQNDDLGDPVLASDAATGRVYFGVLANGGFSIPDIGVLSSTDGGANFGPAVDGTPGTTDSQDKEWMAVDNFAGPGQGNVYLANRDFSTGNGIYFYRSTNQGASFGPTGGVQIASGATGNVQGPQVAVGPNHNVYVAYYDFSGATPIMGFRKSVDQGVSFGPAVTVTTYNTTGVNGNLGLPFRTSTFPQMVVNPVNGDVYVAWADVSANGDADVFFSMSTDTGATWSAPQRINNDTTTNSQWQPSLAVTPDGQHVFMGWYDTRLDPGDAMIDNFGAVADVNLVTHAVTFNPNFRITQQAFPAVFGVDPQLNRSYMGDYDQSAADNNFFYYSFADNVLGDPNVYLARIPTTGPRGPTVFDKQPAGTITTPASSVTLTFSEPMDQTSFSLSDIKSFTSTAYGATYDNLLNPNNITGFKWVNSTTLEIDFVQQLGNGAYTMVLGPNIKSASTGLKLDENLNGTPGESPADDVTVNFTYDPGLGYTTPPTANAHGPYIVSEGNNVTLNGTGTDANDPPSALVYQWDLNGDGIFGETGANATNGDETGQHPVFKAATVDGPASFTVKFRTIDRDGLVSPVQTATIIVNDVPPTVTINGPTSIVEGSPAKFTAVVTDTPIDVTEGITYTYTWSATMNGAPFSGFSGQGTPSISFTDNDVTLATGDKFVVSLVVTSSEGMTAPTATANLTVNDGPPTATFSNDGPKVQRSTFNFTFSNQSDPSPLERTGFRYSYDFNNDGNFTSPGDIANTTSSTASLVFNFAGTFTVHGQITNTDGLSTDYFTQVIVIQLGNGGIITKPHYATGSGPGDVPLVKEYNDDGTLLRSFLAFDFRFTGGVRVATGDVNGDGVDDIIAAAGPGGGPHVVVFDGATGAVIRSFFAYDPSFTGGVFLASGDVNSDFYDDIITGAGAGGGPNVKAFSGRDGTLLKSFFAYSPAFTGGVSVGVGDFNHDTFTDIITGAGPSGGPHVKVFSGVDGSVLRSFFAFEGTFAGGVNVAGGDVNHDGTPDIVVARGAQVGTNSQVRVFNGVDGSMIWEFVAYPQFRGGINVATEDVNHDGFADIVVAPGPSSAPAVTSPGTLILSGKNLTQLGNFYPYDPTFLGGIYVG
ncbi:MAG: FG-GAP-like repeat-containing protein [Gemmataceae bacterium]